MRIALAAMLLAAAVAPASAKELVTNGDFTDLTNGLGQITSSAGITKAVGWTTSGYNLVMSVADHPVADASGPTDFAIWDAANGGANAWDGAAPDGGNFAALDGDYKTGALKQTISDLTVGKTYVLDFDYAFSQQKRFSGATVQHLTASVGSTSWTSANYDLPSHGFSGWMDEKLTFVATSTTETLSFLAYGNVPVPPFALVSDVSLLAAPEPATWAMMLAGFAGLGYAGYRSARRKTVVA